MMRISHRRLGMVSLIALVALLVSTGIASAHEHRDVGEYTLTVGFLNEPAIANQPNGASLEVVKGHDDAVEDSGTPVEGIDSLQVEVTFGGESKTYDLESVFGMPGAYRADFIPTRDGSYTFRFFGTIEGTEIDETFTSGPDTFSDVQSEASVSFPAATDADAGNSAVDDAQDAADSAKTLAIVGIVIGALGLVAGAAGLYMAMNARSGNSGASGTGTTV